LPTLPTGGVGEPRRNAANCKFRNSFPLTAQQQQLQPAPCTMPLLTFCKLVLDYENYPDYDDHPEDRKRHSSSPLGSTGSSSGSGWEQGPPPPPPTSTTNASSSNGPSSAVNHNATKTEDLPMTPARQTPRPTSPAFQSSPDHDHGTEDSSAVDDDEVDAEDGWNSVTCFCRKPFAGRPMIECTGCLVWVHLKCAKLNRRKIPDEWFCGSCRGSLSVAGSPSSSSLTSPPPSAQRAPTPTSSSKSNKTPKGANRKSAAPSPSKPAGARKRKSSLTAKRVVVISNNGTNVPLVAGSENSSSPQGAAPSSSPDRSDRTSDAQTAATPSGDSGRNFCETSASSPDGNRGEWLPKRLVKDENS